ncbi:MAG: bifunctional nuclease domain-containing protein [Bacteroidia bacterium]
MNRIRLDITGLSSSQSQIGHYALVLGEVGGNRRLPIIIGGAEAQAIALELESIKTNRPMTHDLFFKFSNHFNILLEEVLINDLEEGIFYARLKFEYEGQIHEIDSRPSDAVALAVRFGAPIFVLDSILDEAGVVMEESEEEEEKSDEFSLAEIETSDPLEDEEEAVAAAPRKRRAKGSLPENLDELNKLLEEALSREDYENAARIRDKIDRMKEGE